MGYLLPLLQQVLPIPSFEFYDNFYLSTTQVHCEAVLNIGGCLYIKRDPCPTVERAYASELTTGETPDRDRTFQTGPIIIASLYLSYENSSAGFQSIVLCLERWDTTRQSVAMS